MGGGAILHLALLVQNMSGRFKRTIVWQKRKFELVQEKIIAESAMEIIPRKEQKSRQVNDSGDVESGGGLKNCRTISTLSKV